MRARRLQHPTRLMIGALGVFLLSCSSQAGADLTDDLFERYEIATGPATSQTILSGAFLGRSGAEIAVVQVENQGRRLRLFGFDGSAWTPVLDATLSPGVLFVDVAQIDGRDRLITYEPGRLNWFDPDSGAEHLLLEVEAHYNAERAAQSYGGSESMDRSHDSEVAHVDITRDLNRDGRDDLVVPNVDGFWISTQLADGAFTQPTKLGPGEPLRDEIAGGDRRSYGEVGISSRTIPWYLSRMHEMDYDRDGRSDLVFWNQDHFEVHRQDESGGFEAEPATFSVEVAFDHDGAYSHLFAFGGEGNFKLMVGLRGRSRHTALYSLRDLNGDGIGDLMTQSIEGRSILRQRARYAVHFGRPAPEGTVFSAYPDTAIQGRGKGGAMQHAGYSAQLLGDLDGDGRIELGLADVAIGPGGMFRALVGNSVPMLLEVHRLENGVFPRQPATRRKFSRFAPFAGLGNIFLPRVVVGDVNGDGRSDLIVGRQPEQLDVYLGIAGPDLLARESHKVAVTLPRDERKVWLADLTGDGKEDLIMYHTPTERAPDEPRRLTLLLAR